MRKLYERIKGKIRVEICGAFPEAVLNACALQALLFWDMESVNAYTIRMSVYEKDLPELKAVAEKSMCELKVISASGGTRNRGFLKRRMWLFLSAALIMAMLLFSSLFVWEIEIRGCEELSTGQVLRALSECGVKRGTFWPGLSTDLVRSRMLTELPELAWMTVNVSGSRALVLVSERQEKPEIYVESQCADIVAGKTGIITRMSVLNGKPLVSRGQSVLEGETLVSGVMDSITNPPRLVRAEGEIIADTWYEICAVSPLESQQKTEERSRRVRFAVKFGENRINLYFGSGKHIDECDKIINEYNLGIQGLFALPVSIVREELIRWEKDQGSSADEQALKERLYQSLQESIDGEIVSHSFSVSEREGLMYVTLLAHCRENIAVIQELDETKTEISVSGLKGTNP